jgi:D-alanyl-lipoteichoic acid acyltransferase DltB (MBOAT superfamily)
MRLQLGGLLKKNFNFAPGIALSGAGADVLFNSIQFLVFFPLVAAAYFAAPQALRWPLLLGASCYFYMAFIPVYILILVLTILVDYFAALYIQASAGRRRRTALVISIAVTCCILFFFKYYDFVISNINRLSSLTGHGLALAPLGLLLPIGLSFHTFQSLSYVIEVYRGRQRAERHFGIYALYVMFFPQLVAGPIERPQNLLHQFYERHELDYERIRDGLRQMLWGFFKKVVIADRLSIYVNTVYANLEHHTGPTVAVATVFFAFQIYCDFSAYSDIAIGAARVLGFSLMTNFNKPYFSRSISEFWRRWHISLSTWFKDYVYVPLGGNRVGRPRWVFNILVTFTISGLWHGAAWTYIVWGALNGVYLVVATTLQGARDGVSRAVGLAQWPRLHQFLKMAITFGLTCVAWVFFRAPDFDEALTALHHMLWNWGPVFTGGAKELIYGALGIATVLSVDWWTGERHFHEAVGGLARAQRWAVYLGLLLWIASAGVFSASQFIYFQF